MLPPRSEGLAEFTLKAVVAGVLLGVVFGAANAYLGLRVGMTVSASIPAAVMTVALFKVVRARGTLLEANLSQTIGSASTSLASGTIFTVPALFLWGMAPPYWQVVTLCFLGGVLGLSAMIPLRRMLIVEAHGELPYPEGTACAEVLRATAVGAGGGGWIFWGMGIGALVKLLIALVFLLPGDVRTELPVLPKAEVALELAPALIGVGFILGYRQASVCMAGAVVSALAIAPLIGWMGEGLSRPLYPETTRLVTEMSPQAIWARYVRYIGAGAVAVAGIVTVVRGLPAMAGAFLAIARRLPRTRGPMPNEPDRSRPAWRLRREWHRVRGGRRGAAAGRLRRRHGRRATGAVCGRRGCIRHPVRGRCRPDRGDRWRFLEPRLGHDPGDAARRGLRLRAGGLDRSRGAGSGAYCRYDRGGRRVQGRGHLAGPEDRLPRRRHACPAAARTAHRRQRRLLGRRWRRATAGQRL
jgi:hypothetical protein